ncbi:hypothetical protein O6H91_01G140200 [Diphasiastrum complanatum]|uniref:Uncharacterized protein n=1 Tax=Diphasiastrum complanatum TaxID=34168 RepID=A0ACC2EWR5_DIPCM|nr:hypothetical protein O6H91_01G140200 [Diphasiastrum complanatum]
MAAITVKNRQILLKDYVTGSFVESDMTFHDGTCLLQLQEGTNDILVKNLYISPDPFLRGRMQKRTNSYVDSFVPGSVITGFGVSQVVMSNNPNFSKGDFVTGYTGWEDFSVIKSSGFLRIIPAIGFPLTYFLGVLGLTAYAGFHEVCSPKEGDQVFVSAASGAVGQLVGQFAKLLGCYVVGSAGSNEKVELLKNTLGFDEAFNYREEIDLDATLKKYFPKGIDIYFENVGGEMLEAVLNNINVFARIAVCGMISRYDSAEPYSIKNLHLLIPMRAKMQGLIATDFSHLYPEVTERVGLWLKEKKIVYIEDLIEGLENAPRAMLDVLRGKNVGKKIVKLSDPYTSLEAL